MSGVCSGCGASQVALIHSTHVLQFYKSTKLVEWDECWACYSKAEQRGAALKSEAEADRLIKFPPTKQRMHNREHQPFISQLDGSE